MNNFSLIDNCTHHFVFTVNLLLDAIPSSGGKCVELDAGRGTRKVGIGDHMILQEPLSKPSFPKRNSFLSRAISACDRQKTAKEWSKNSKVNQ
jgi:hypothetical protein